MARNAVTQGWEGRVGLANFQDWRPLGTVEYGILNQGTVFVYSGPFRNTRDGRMGNVRCRRCDFLFRDTRLLLSPAFHNYRQSLQPSAIAAPAPFVWLAWASFLCYFWALLVNAVWGLTAQSIHPQSGSRGWRPRGYCSIEISRSHVQRPGGDLT